MNAVILFIIFVIGSKSSSAETNETFIKIENFIYERCRSNLPEAVFEDKISDLAEYEYNIEMLIIFHLLLADDHNCTDHLRDVLSHLVRKGTDILLECFPKERHIPKLINQSVTEYFNFICASNGKNIDDLYLSGILDCNIKPTSKDISYLDKIILLPNNEILTKNQICRGLKTVEKFYDDILRRDCPNHTNHILAVNKLFGAIYKPCVDIQEAFESQTNSTMR